MNSVSNSSDARRRRRAIAALRAALRDSRAQLSALNHQVGSRVQLRDVDLECLDIISSNGPVSPSALARLAGLHPATMTGILDRLERGGWILRERDESDRRAVAIRMLPARNAEIFRHYSGMNGRIDEICAGYDDDQLDVIVDFLGRISEAATAELAGGSTE